MRRSGFVFILAALTLTGFVGTAAAQSPPGDGRIDVFADEGGQQCYLIDDQPGIVSFHFFQFEPGGPSGVQFYFPVPECWTGATWLSDTWAWSLFLGNSQDPTLGVAVVYGGCKPNPVYLGTINFFTTGTGQTCCEYTVLGPAINAGLPKIVDCTGIEQSAAGGTIVINPDHTCFCMGPVPTEETSWGKVKSLYK